MDREELAAYCLTKPGAWEDEPWEGDVVAKVHDKIFAFLGSDPGTSVGVKCGLTRDEADEWLARHPDDASVMAYIGRSGWNTLAVGGSIPDDEIFEAVDTSYDLVVSRLPKKHRPPAPPDGQPPAQAQRQRERQGQIQGERR
ncbi:MAG TPA: MmcQ/YjbR family DNA-binding protein [Nocardioidaceae bacterium]|jgi:predicted DNA-binding protein (MmcQ/YjbR family)|nr:MmcQ/YjbR family DNA-binding protein [Nocardioidaceae bacterium]